MLDQIADGRTDLIFVYLDGNGVSLRLDLGAGSVYDDA
jgi:hypothetical protein